MGLASLITREQPRMVDQRSEERQRPSIGDAVIIFRGQQHTVRVVDISSRGTRIESDIRPAIGETVIVEFDQCSRLNAFVRWLRGGEIGLNFGHEIVLAA